MRWPLQWAARARQIVLTLMVLVAFALSFVGDRKDVWILRFCLSLMVISLTSGWVGALIEILFGPNRLIRAFFVLCGIVAVVGRVLDNGTRDNPATIAAIAAMFFLWMGGFGTWLLRWRDHRRQWPIVLAAGRDLARGEVLVFQEAKEQGLDAIPGAADRGAVWELSTKPAPDEDLRGVRHIELLPESHFAFSADGKVLETWEVLEPVSPALRPQSVVETRVPDPKTALSSQTTQAQRAFTEAEANELRVEMRRALRSDLGKAVFAAWICGQLARLFKGPPAPGQSVDVFALSVVAIVGVAFVTLAIRRRIHFKRDLIDGALVVRPQAPVPEGPAYVEVLAASKILWTIDGQPAPWRRTAAR